MNKRSVTTGSGEMQDYSCCMDDVQLQDYTGRFIMFFVITNIYNKKTK